MRVVELGHLSLVYDENAIRVHDGVETVSDGENCARRELAANGRLNQIIGSERKSNEAN